MAEYPIELGKDGPSNPCCVPMNAAKSETYYPSAYLNGLPEDFDLPESGTITFKYRVCRESKDYKNENASCDLDLLQIVSVTAAPGVKDKEAENAFDAAASEVMGDE